LSLGRGEVAGDRHVARTIFRNQEGSRYLLLVVNDIVIVGEIDDVLHDWIKCSVLLEDWLHVVSPSRFVRNL
jgi:hypothetical protein